MTSIIITIIDILLQIKMGIVPALSPFSMQAGCGRRDVILHQISNNDEKSNINYWHMPFISILIWAGADLEGMYRYGVEK